MIANWLPKGLRRKAILLMLVMRHNSSFSRLLIEKKNQQYLRIWVITRHAEWQDTILSITGTGGDILICVKKERMQEENARATWDVFKVTFLDTFLLSPVKWIRISSCHLIYIGPSTKSVDCRILPSSWLEGRRRCYQVWNFDTFIRNTCWSFKSQQLLAVQTT